MIFITGDTHGEIDYPKLLKLKEFDLTYDDYLIICGDVGICWSTERLEIMLNLYRNIGCTILFIDGNHENFELLSKFRLVEYKGALMHQLDEHIFHIMRGEIVELDGKSFLCIGGAHSIDKMYRIPYVSWWPEEDITDNDINNALWNLEKVSNKVDYVITHCCDSLTVTKAFHFKRDNSSDKLNFIDKIVTYKHWFFGHYHFDMNVNEKKTCLYQEIIKLSD